MEIFNNEMLLIHNAVLDIAVDGEEHGRFFPVESSHSLLLKDGVRWRPSSRAGEEKKELTLPLVGQYGFRD